MFMIYRPRLGARGLLGLARAFQPGGMARAGLSGAVRMIARFSLSDWLRGQLATSVVARSAPPSWGRLLRRCKFTVAAFALNPALYLATTGPDGRLPAETERAWGFSWSAFTSVPWHALALSPWLHWSPSHLFLNLVMLAAFTGALEYLAGTRIAAACYLVPAALANPAAGGLLALLKPWVASISLSEPDVGASLGIFGTAGALAHFLRHGRPLVAGLALAALLSAVAMQAYMPINHLAALVIGWAVGRLILKD